MKTLLLSLGLLGVITLTGCTVTQVDNASSALQSNNATYPSKSFSSIGGGAMIGGY